MNRRIALALLLLVGCSTPAAREDEADVVFRGALIYDGTGREGATGDLALRGDRLVAVGTWSGPARKVIDARGLIAAPGFIDLHNHSDASILAEETRDNYNFTTQGCTTIVTGNCGLGTVDAAQLFRGIDDKGAGTNVIHLLPHRA